MPHQLCHFHYLREAALPVYEADRHAKVQLKKKVRGIRPIERKVEGRDDAEAEAIRGYCAAVRSALTDDGRPPLEASGLKLRDRLAKVADEPGPGRREKGLPKELTRLRAILAKGLEATAASWPEVRAAFGWVRRLAAVLANKKGLDAAAVRRRYRGLIAALARHRGSLGSLAEAFDHFRKVTRSYWPGLFRLLRRGGPAADEQRPGAVLRLVPLPRAAVQRPEGGLPGDGGARLGAAGGGGGDAAAAGRGGGPGPLRPDGLA